MRRGIMTLCIWSRNRIYLAYMRFEMVRVRKIQLITMGGMNTRCQWPRRIFLTQFKIINSLMQILKSSAISHK